MILLREIDPDGVRQRGTRKMRRRVYSSKVYRMLLSSKYKLKK